MNIIVVVCGQLVLLVSVINQVLLRSVLNDDCFPKLTINLETYIWNFFITSVSINYYIFNTFYMSVCVCVREFGSCNSNLDYYLVMLLKVILLKLGYYWAYANSICSRWKFLLNQIPVFLIHSEVLLKGCERKDKFKLSSIL